MKNDSLQVNKIPLLLIIWENKPCFKFSYRLRIKKHLALSGHWYNYN